MSPCRALQFLFLRCNDGWRVRYRRNWNSLPMCALPRERVWHQTMIQETWLQSRYLAMDGRSESDIIWLLGGTPHCSLLKVVRPEEPNGVSPFLFFRRLCSWHLFVARNYFLSSVPTTTTAPSLCALVPSGTLLRFGQFLQRCFLSLSFTQYRWGPLPLHYWIPL
jgi:hypothetical protein